MKFLAELRRRHRQLDDLVAEIEASDHPDMLRVRRLKKEKLHLRDQITSLEDQLRPDIIA